MSHVESLCSWNWEPLSAGACRRHWEADTAVLTHLFHPPGDETLKKIAQLETAGQKEEVLPLPREGSLIPISVFPLWRKKLQPNGRIIMSLAACASPSGLTALTGSGGRRCLEGSGASRPEKTNESLSRWPPIDGCCGILVYIYIYMWCCNGCTNLSFDGIVSAVLQAHVDDIHAISCVCNSHFAASHARPISRSQVSKEAILFHNLRTLTCRRCQSEPNMTGAPKHLKVTTNLIVLVLPTSTFQSPKQLGAFWVVR